ncbi:MAG: hypothetical protein LBJ35_02090 [Spirochaetaceae bacterium]|nr:hypothetical protein [Spirochaetaceae bacterium]
MKPTGGRSGRETGQRFGELVQFDGSPRAWFENRGPRCCLITMTDDATKIRLSKFFEEETTAGVMTAAASPSNYHIEIGRPDISFTDISVVLVPQ